MLSFLQVLSSQLGIRRRCARLTCRLTSSGHTGWRRWSSVRDRTVSTTSTSRDSTPSCRWRCPTAALADWPTFERYRLRPTTATTTCTTSPHRRQRREASRAETDSRVASDAVVDAGVGNQRPSSPAISTTKASTASRLTPCRLRCHIVPCNRASGRRRKY